MSQSIVNPGVSPPSCPFRGQPPGLVSVASPSSVTLVSSPGSVDATVQIYVAVAGSAPTGPGGSVASDLLPWYALGAPLTLAVGVPQALSLPSGIETLTSYADFLIQQPCAPRPVFPFGAAPVPQGEAIVSDSASGAGAGPAIVTPPRFPPPLATLQVNEFTPGATAPGPAYVCFLANIAPSEPGDFLFDVS